MEELFLPVLHSFENNNVFTGSYGALRFKVTPAIKGEHDRIKENCRCGRKKELATWNERALPTKPMWRF